MDIFQGSGKGGLPVTLVLSPPFALDLVTIVMSTFLNFLIDAFLHRLNNKGFSIVNQRKGLLNVTIFLYIVLHTPGDRRQKVSKDYFRK